jgi:gamma-glutamyltranspeptidase
MEETFPMETRRALEALGHKIRVWPKLPRKSSMCVVRRLSSGVLEAGADIRGEAYGIAW